MKICESAKLSTFFPFSYAWRHTIRDLRPAHSGRRHAVPTSMTKPLRLGLSDILGTLW